MSETIQSLPVRSVRLDEMSPAAYNPRLRLEPGSERYEALKKAMLRFGEAGGIVWNERTGNIVGGHQRYWILRDEGIEEWPVSIGSYTDQEERAFNIALNRQGSEWDLDLLPEAYARIDHDLRYLTGFDEDSIADMLRSAEIDGHLSFLDGIDDDAPLPGVGAPELKDDHPHRTGKQYFQFQLVLDQDQRDTFFEAVNAAKAAHSLDNTMSAIVAVCRHYLDAG